LVWERWRKGRGSSEGAEDEDAVDEVQLCYHCVLQERGNGERKVVGEQGVSGCEGSGEELGAVGGGRDVTMKWVLAEKSTMSESELTSRFR